MRLLENRGVEEANSIKECVQVGERLENLEKIVSLRQMGAEKKVEKLVEQYNQL